MIMTSTFWNIVQFISIAKYTKYSKSSLYFNKHDSFFIQDVVPSYHKEAFSFPNFPDKIRGPSCFIINPYPVNVENMVSSYQRHQMEDGI